MAWDVVLNDHFIVAEMHEVADELATLIGICRRARTKMFATVGSYELCRLIGRSLPTVKRHLANIYQKLGCTNRVQASNVFHWGNARGGR